MQHYTAFGIPSTGSPRMGPYYTLPTRYGYAGAWGYENLSVLSPPSSVLLHVGERFYDPTIGRFLQRDPIGIAGGLNVYAYVGNNPLVFVDPRGLQYYPRNIKPGAEWLPPQSPEYLPPGSPGWQIDPRGTGPWIPKSPITPPRWTGPVSRLPKAPVVLACAGAAIVGYAAGTGIDYAVGKITGRSISDRLGDLFYRTCPSCFDWGL